MIGAPIRRCHVEGTRSSTSLNAKYGYRNRDHGKVNMPIFLNRNPSKRLPKGKRRAAPVRPSRRIALDVRHAIAGTMRGLIEDIEHLTPWLAGTATLAQAAQVLRDLQDRWRVLYGPQAQRLAEKWVAELSAD